MADERTTSKPINVNDQIKDRTIRHMVYLERFKAGELRKLKKTLETVIIPEVEEKIRKRLAKGLPTNATSKRLKELRRELGKIATAMTASIKKEVVIDIDALTKQEIDFQINMIKEELGVDIDFVVPNARDVAAVVKSQPFTGLTMDQWFGGIKTSTQRKITQAVQRGIVEGETVSQIVQRIRGTRANGFTDGVMNATKVQAEAVARTAINYASNTAKDAVYQANSDIIKGVQWVATLDSRTSTICAGLDGKVFPLGKGVRPPAHVNCRSTITPVIKDYRKLGLRKLPAGKRASINGQVAGDVTYGQWLKKQPASIQKEVLGATRAKLFRDGKLPIDRFTTKGLQPLTLDELRVKEINAFKKADLDA